MSRPDDVINVLHVDDEPDFADMAAEFVERQDERIEVETALRASTGLDRLGEDRFDCVVSDLDMPGKNGIEFLEAVRESHPELPFILFTGKGSEEVASEAISAGVTDYLQKESGTSQYAVLANRITNAVEQRRSHEKATESERRLRTIAENTKDILWKFTADWDELLFINSPYETIWGRSIDELRRNPQSFLEGVHPEDRDRVEEAMSQLSAGETVDIEYRVNADEGYGRWVWVQGQPVFDEDGEVDKVVGYARDITERRERIRRLDTLSSNLPGIVYRCRNEPDWRMDLVRGDCESLTGYPAEALEDGDVVWGRDIIHPDDREAMWDVVQEALDEDRTFEVTYRIRTKDGDTRWMWERGQLVDSGVMDEQALEGFITDITERKEREQAIEDLHTTARAFMQAESKEAIAEITADTLRDILDMSANGVHLYDEESGTLVPVAWTNQTEAIVGDPPPTFAPGEGIAGEAYETGDAQIYDDITTVDHRYNPDTAVRSQITLPLGDHGVVVIGSADPGAFDDTDIDLARTLATHATTALERIEHEQSLREYKTLVETVGDPMYVLDTEGYIEKVNQVMLEHLEADRETVVGSHVQEFMAEGDFERGTELIGTLLEDPDRDWGTFEFTAVTTAGDHIPAELNLAILTDDTGTVTGSVGVIREITERKQYEQKLTALHDVADALTRSESVQEVCDRTIDASEAILDFDLSVIDFEEAGMLTKQTASGNVPPANMTDMSVEDGIAGKTYRTGTSFIIDDLEENPIADPQGPYRSAISVPIGAYGIFQAVANTTDAFDETDLELAELLISHTESALDRLTRDQQLHRQNSRLEKFASVVSHDLRNPLNVAKGRLELAQEESESDHLGDAADAVDRSLTLIDDLLTLAREGEQVSETEAVDLAAVIDGCWRNVETADATLHNETDRRIQADPSRLKQLLENLFRNAVEHGGADVTVTVGDLSDGNGFYVADDGPGIPADERDDVFEAGYSTTDTGTGFGLNIVFEIAEAHDWVLTVTDSDSGGARFEVAGVTSA